MTEDFLLMCAPLQGFTDVAFRHYHAAMYPAGGKRPVYFTPFIRVESESVRSRDLKELQSPLNTNHDVIPQIIFRSSDEFRLLVDTLAGYGFKAIDMNLGCPHIPQAKKGRGAGLLEKPDVLREIQHIMLEEYPHIMFSLKMRLGISDASGWLEIADILQKMPLAHVALHPRTAVQQYSGDLDFDQARNFVSEIGHRVIFNGNILCPADIDVVRARIPAIAGVMVGRGLLMRPSLFSEWIEESVWSDSRQRAAILAFHDGIFGHYSSVLIGGEAQILSKIKPIWEYFGVNFDRKLVKKIIKSRRIESYREAVDMLRRQ